MTVEGFGQRRVHTALSQPCYSPPLHPLFRRTLPTWVHVQVLPPFHPLKVLCLSLLDHLGKYFLQVLLLQRQPSSQWLPKSVLDKAHVLECADECGPAGFIGCAAQPCPCAGFLQYFNALKIFTQTRVLGFFNNLHLRKSHVGCNFCILGDEKLRSANGSPFRNASVQ